MTALPAPDPAPPPDVDHLARLAVMATRPPVPYLPADGRDPGRPILLDADVRLRIIETIELGSPYHVAARWAGVSRSSFHAWRKRGEDAAALRDAGERVPKKERPFLQLHDDMEQAEARAHRRVIAHLNTHFRTDARACITFLERRFPDDWSASVQVTGTGGGPVQVEMDAGAFVDAAFARLAEMHAEMAVLPAALDDGVVDVTPVE